MTLKAVVAQWIRRLATDQKIGGSTPPVGDTIFGSNTFLKFLRVRKFTGSRLLPSVIPFCGSNTFLKLGRKVE